MTDWVQHESHLSPDGRTLCIRCQREFSRLLPTNQIICTRGTWLSLGPRPDATPCQPS